MEKISKMVFTVFFFGISFSTNLALSKGLSDESSVAQSSAGTLGVVSESIQNRREKLISAWMRLSESDAERVLRFSGYSNVQGKGSRESLQDFILDAQNPSLLVVLESSFFRNLSN